MNLPICILKEQVIFSPIVIQLVNIGVSIQYDIKYVNNMILIWKSDKKWIMLLRNFDLTHLFDDNIICTY